LSPAHKALRKGVKRRWRAHPGQKKESEKRRGKEHSAVTQSTCKQWEAIGGCPGNALYTTTTHKGPKVREGGAPGGNSTKLGEKDGEENSNV